MGFVGLDTFVCPNGGGKEEHVDEAPHDVRTGDRDLGARQGDQDQVLLGADAGGVLGVIGRPQQGNEVAEPAAVGQEEPEEQLGAVGRSMAATNGTR